MIDDKELIALISLLDDSDREILDHVSSKLLSFGPTIIPNLEHAWEISGNTHLQERIEQLIHHIQFDSSCDSLKSWMKTDPDNVLEGALQISRFQYPDADFAEVERKVKRVGRDIWIEMNEYMDPQERIHVFNQVFYRLNGFNGKQVEPNETAAYFLNNVLENKKGNVLSLGLLYLSIAQFLSLPLYGINLPRHFSMAYMRDHITDFDNSNHQLEKQVLFYINPLHNGLIFTRGEINEYLKKVDEEPKTEYFTPISNLETVKLLPLALHDAYEYNSQTEKAAEMLEISKLFG